MVLFKIMLMEKVATFSDISSQNRTFSVNIHGILMCMNLFTLSKILNIQIVFNIFLAFHCYKVVIQLS